MREPPSPSKLVSYPVVGGVAMLAIAVTLADISKAVDVSPLYADHHVREGQVWRLATSILPHVDVIHLAFNVYWLWVLGSLVEEQFGHVRTFLLVLLFGVGSSAAEYAFVHGGVGLSGVGYGLFGFLWVLSRRDDRFRGAVDDQTSLLFVGWFFLCIVTTYAGVWDVANVAHGVGAVFGGLAALTVSGGRRRPLYGTAALLLLAAFGAAVYARPYVNLTAERAYDRAGLGYEASENDQNASAVRHYRAAIAAAKGRPEPSWWFNLGIAHQSLGEFAEAKHAYQRAAELDPSQDEFREAVEAVEAIVAARNSTDADGRIQTRGKTNADAPATTRSIETP